MNIKEKICVPCAHTHTSLKKEAMVMVKMFNGSVILSEGWTRKSWVTSDVKAEYKCMCVGACVHLTSSTLCSPRSRSYSTVRFSAWDFMALTSLSDFWRAGDAMEQSLNRSGTMHLNDQSLYRLTPTCCLTTCHCTI